MRRPASQLALAVVALMLGLLVVVQLRAQSSGSQLDGLSAQELTVLVANLNARNDQLRTEIAGLDAEATALQAAQARGDSGLDQLRQDLARVRGWAGLDAVEGMGVRLTVAGPLAGQAVEDILNELRNAGAEAAAAPPATSPGRERRRRGRGKGCVLRGTTRSSAPRYFRSARRLKASSVLGSCTFVSSSLTRSTMAWGMSGGFATWTSTV